MKNFGYVIGSFFILLLVFILYVFGAAIIFAYPISFLWNETMYKFGLPKLDFWDAFCLYLLFSLLFKSFQKNNKEND
jgi:hypothetical protein